MTKCKNELKILKDSIKKKIDVYKYNEKNDIYIKYKSLIHRCDKQIDKDRIRLGSYLFKKDEAYMNEKDINKLLNKIIKKKITHEYIWNRIKNMIFKFNLVNIDNQNDTSLSTNSSKSLTYIKNNKKNILFYNKCYDHINVYLLSIALQVMNKRNSTFSNFLYSYINAFFENMEPRHFLYIFYILVKNTYRDLNQILNNNQTNEHNNNNNNNNNNSNNNNSNNSSNNNSNNYNNIHIKDCQLYNINHILFVKQNYAHHIYYSQKNFIELLNKFCIDKINYFSFNDIGLVCAALSYFSLKQNPFVEFWNEFLLYIFDIHKVNQRNITYAQKRKHKIYQHGKDKQSEIYSHEKDKQSEIYQHEKDKQSEIYHHEKDKQNEKYSYVQNSQNEKYSYVQNSQNEKYSYVQNSQKKNSFFSDNPSEKKHEHSESFIKRKMKASKKIDHSLIDYDKYIELNGKNILSILKYIVSYYEIYPCIKKVANRISIILVDLSMDLTLHECSEIIYYLNSLNELDQIFLKDKISIYEYQLKDTFLTTYDIGCLLKIAQVLNEQNYYGNIPFLHIFLYNIHKFSLENATLLFHLICKNYENDYMNCNLVEEMDGAIYKKKKKKEIFFKNDNDDKFFVNNKNLLKGLCTLLISYEDIIKNMSYKEMFFLCEILNKEQLFVHPSILGYICNRLCDDIETYKFSLLNFSSYVDYIMFITIFIYNNKYNDDKLLNNIYSLFLCNHTDYMLTIKNMTKNKIYHYCFYLLCIKKDMTKCVTYLNFILKSVSLFEPLMLYYIILIYFYKSAKNNYKNLCNIKHINKKKKKKNSISFSNSKDIIKSNINMNNQNNLYKPFINLLNEQEFDEELLRLFLPMWNVILSRRGRKMLDFLIVLNKFYDNINVRHYLFHERVIRKVDRYIKLVHMKNKRTNKNIKCEENIDYDKYFSCMKNSGFIILCHDPIIKQPVLFDINKLELIKIQRNNIYKNEMSTNDYNKEKKIEESINYLINDYKYKKDIIIKRDSTKYSKPAKYFQNYKRGTSVQQFLSIYDD
ncbi:hypothetical protein PGSY75_0716700 [Plasmodium gaboni]|uniref:Uncharacterized protein n=1 Tax=Plasmodium gaboni TaxID=647221 RepID=A0A151LQ38_9APIC|nr:hypothetical protein PGSY75_0716700 [Plasmodium gaboni]KYO01305.1 hypothetical protein PGSY75_0716700 [Plasmodium gaboni]